MTPQAVAKFQTSSFETQVHQKSSDSSSATTIIADDRLGGKRDEAYPKVEDHSQAHTQRGASSEEVQFIKEERNSLNEAGRENGEYLRRKAAERDAVQALAKLGMLQARPPSPPLEKKKPIKFKDAVGRKFSFPFELCSTWQATWPLTSAFDTGNGGSY
ncbi:uncharacterized protein N7458_009079 [Penicillium daleae]|uniref:Ubiquitin-like domain-containing protein n=1 Tax=Penicillium daleae TaxID=63821 RepID=A0AAD6BYI2_9EURO|nr:uncharacterized protein N7458_009079 [Penicillium daleae]KAJ5438081.1 hypothetical protein N7458_009079 [Penicillium daleae]